MDKIKKSGVFRILLFILMMFFVFYMTFDCAGAFLSGLLSDLIKSATDALGRRLLEAGVSAAFYSLIISGVCSGIGSVLSFVPTIAVLFFFISVMESCGYMAQVAFILDRYLSKIGLPGESAVPMLIGFGCSVPAIIAVKTIPRRRDRLLTTALIPFISCSAKLPIYTIFISVFFPDMKLPVLTCVYLTGIFAAILCSLILSRTLYKESPRQSGRKGSCKTPPGLCAPSPRFVASSVLGNTLGFVKKAFTVIFMASVIVWFLQSFDSEFSMTSDSGQSLLACFGKRISPIFAPLGFGDWRACSALIAGLTAKEAIVSTLSVLTCTMPGLSAAEMTAKIFTPLSSFTFMIFCLLYVPCIATMVTMKKETGSIKYVLFSLLVQMSSAWLAAFVIFRAGSLISVVFP